jgi:hypothetical protein
MLPAHNLLRTLRSDLERQRDGGARVQGLLALAIGYDLFRDTGQIPWDKLRTAMAPGMRSAPIASERLAPLDPAAPTSFLVSLAFGEDCDVRAFDDHAFHLARGADGALTAAGLPGLPLRHYGPMAGLLLALIRLAADAPGAFRFDPWMFCWPKNPVDFADAQAMMRDGKPARAPLLLGGPPRWDTVEAAAGGNPGLPDGLYLYMIDRDVIEASIEAADYLMAMGGEARGGDGPQWIYGTLTKLRQDLGWSARYSAKLRQLEAEKKIVLEKTEGGLHRMRVLSPEAYNPHPPGDGGG